MRELLRAAGEFLGFPCSRSMDIGRYQEFHRSRSVSCQGLKISRQGHIEATGSNNRGQLIRVIIKSMSMRREIYLGYEARALLCVD